MWFIGKSILAYLIRENIKDKEKEKLITKRQALIKLEISNLKDEDLINYLLHPNMPIEVKELICERINKIGESIYSSDKKHLEELTRIFTSKKQFTPKQLKYDFYPNPFKKVIIDNLYKEKPVNLIFSNTVNTPIKKVIIEVSLSNDELLRLLANGNVPKSLKEHIIDKRINSDYEISHSLGDNSIPEELRKEIVITKINKSNIFKVLKWAYGERIEFIKDLKAKELEEIVEEQTTETVLELFDNYETPDFIIDELYTRKLDIIVEAIKTAPKNKIKEVLRKETSPKTIELIIKYRGNDLFSILKGLNEYEVLSYLNLKLLPLEYKDFIISQHEKTIERRINELSKSEIDLYYTNSDSHLPQRIQLQIVRQRRDDFVKAILAQTDDEIIKSLKYNHTIPAVTELIIELRVNENNLLEILSDNYSKEGIVDLLIEKKNDLILQFLEKQSINNLFQLKGKPHISDFAKNKIIDKNKDFFLSKINTLSTDEKYELLNSYDTIEMCKKLILESLNIKDIDLNIVLDLLKTGDSKLILDNFSKIKDFITSANISFESFIQYGSGSQKHSNWLENIINIINTDQINDFLKVKDYLFNNYYSDDNEKENTVYIINNFLEVIENFEKYKELCLNLTSSNKELSKEDKLNISFLFNISNITTSVELPKTLEELSEFKSKIYEEYINKITDSSTTHEELRDIFNNLLLCNSNTTLEYIGGTGALRTLKKDNQNSNTIIRLVDELMSYSRIIELVNDTNNTDGLRKVLEYTFKDINSLTKMQNIFSEFEKKVTRLYELDSKNNLTTLERNKSIEGVLSEELSLKYGGEVYDFSDKNYTLYAHVCSRREKFEDIVNGVSSGKSNFISVSPISYKGQKYYWDRSELIIAYDKIPNGSFVCSSIQNMGSNGNISNNSSEVEPIKRKQRGILETSAVTRNNAEALLYREGLIPCGLILPGGREPTALELEYHEKYNLPFIITQEIEEAIENPKMILQRAEDKRLKSVPANELEEIKKLLETNVRINKEDDEYTGREVALITDCHSMYEPTLAVLEDIRRHGIDEIYSLGDNVGVGPNPSEVFDLLEEYNVKSVAGNSEYYNTLGIEPFPYFTEQKAASQKWTEEKLGKDRIKKLRLYPASIDLMMGNKKIALCHFANDVRWDFREHSTHTYQARYGDPDASEQFLYTNSPESNTKINNVLSSHKKSTPKIRGYASSKKEPLFGGKKVTDYDAVIQGHVHFDMDDYLEDTDIYTLRAVGMGYGKTDSKDTACYYVLRERTDETGYDLEQRLVRFNRNSLLSNIYTSDIPNKELVLRFVKPEK